MMKLTITILLLLICFGLVFGQAQREFGSVNELKGLTKIFIDAGLDLKNRDRIIKTIVKSKIPVKIQLNRKGAEIILMFSGSSSSQVVGETVNIWGDKDTVTGTSTIDRRKIMKGTGMLIIRGKVNKDIPRVLMVTSSTKKHVFQYKPARKFAKKFIRAWKKANNWKKSKKK